MTNQPRLHAAVRSLLLSILLLPALALATPAAASPTPYPIVDKVAEGYGTDPVGTVTALQAIYADPAHPERAAAGRALLRALLLQKQ